MSLASSPEIVSARLSAQAGHRVVLGQTLTLYDRVWKPARSYLADGTEVLEPRSRAPLIALVVLLLGAISVYVTGFSFAVLATRGHQFFVIMKGMFIWPDWSFWPRVVNPLFDTIKMSVIGSLVGSLLAIPMAVLASTNMIAARAVVIVARVFLALVRTLPSLVTALIATFIFGMGTTAGAVAIGLFTFSYIGKQLYEMIETADMGPDEAMVALGAARPKTFWVAIFPQVLPAYVSACLFCFEGNVRYAAILGYVGAGGIGLILNENVGLRFYDRVGIIVVMLFVTVVVIESLSHFIRKRLT